MIRIAIIDDHQMFLDGIQSVLSAEPDFLVTFTDVSAKSALLKIKQQPPDLVITDISMPELNGIEFIKIVKNHFPDIKILVLSMFENLQTFDDMDGYLLKETDKSTLIDAVRAIVLNDEKIFTTKENKNNTFEFRHSLLSDREKQIIQLIAEEFTTEEIAEKLFVSKGTIETHRKNIFFKLQVRNIAGLIKKAVYLGIVK